MAKRGGTNVVSAGHLSTLTIWSVIRTPTPRKYFGVQSIFQTIHFLPAAKQSGLREQITLCFRPSVVRPSVRRPRTSSLVSSVSVEYHKLRIFGHRGYPW